MLYKIVLTCLHNRLHKKQPQPTYLRLCLHTYIFTASILIIYNKKLNHAKNKMLYVYIILCKYSKYVSIVYINPVPTWFFSAYIVLTFLKHVSTNVFTLFNH